MTCFVEDVPCNRSPLYLPVLKMLSLKYTSVSLKKWHKKATMNIDES